MNLQVSLNSDLHWGTGGNGTITIVNLGESITNWSLSLITKNFTINQFWQFIIQQQGTPNNIIALPNAWNNILGKGATITSGFAYTGSSQFEYETSARGKDDNSTIIDLDTTKNKVVFGYFSEWSIYDRQFSVDMIRAKQLTHIVYAFMLPNPSQTDFNTLSSNYPFPPKPYYNPPTIPEGKITYHDEYAATQNISKLKTLKSMYPSIKILISIGGWTLSWTLSKVVADPVL